MTLQTPLKSDSSTSIYVIVIDFTIEKKLKEAEEKLIITIKFLYLSKKLLNSREKVHKNN